ncbi:Hypothetical_protein [Hexamita inflata]|uniref:Hypothetical_protein n=1 Tax=Hexamita inflata TaxID=28002 RepID=A0AA86P4S8_9EUKA|nr:Hypothetical protein HINF_LOCUS18054 [Hexamita inflata]
MILLTLARNLQVFSIAEFDFCYNYVFYRPFQERTALVQHNPFTFEGGINTDLCSRSENVLFREINQSSFSIKIDCEFDLQQQPFSLFFFVFSNVSIIDTEINMKLSNSNNEFAFLVATIPEYSIEIRGCSFEFESKSPVSNFYGIANNIYELLVINRSQFSYNYTATVSKFYGYIIDYLLVIRVLRWGVLRCNQQQKSNQQQRQSHFPRLVFPTSQHDVFL